MEDAWEQDADNVRELLNMRRFRDLYRRMNDDKGSLKQEDWDFLEWADALQEAMV